MKKISIVIPMYYEEEVANECYNRMTSVCKSIENYEYEIIFRHKNPCRWSAAVSDTGGG